MATSNREIYLTNQLLPSSFAPNWLHFLAAAPRLPLAQLAPLSHFRPERRPLTVVRRDAPLGRQRPLVDRVGVASRRLEPEPPQLGLGAGASRAARQPGRLARSQTHTRPRHTPRRAFHLAGSAARHQGHFRLLPLGAWSLREDFHAFRFHFF